MAQSIKKGHTVKEALAHKAREPHKSVLSPLSFADALSIPHEISRPFLFLVEKWMASNGVECTVKRLKNLKTDFIRVASGMDACTPWVARKGNRFKGPLGGLQKWSNRSGKNFKRAIQLLMVYTREISPEVTHEQEVKFLISVEAPVVPIKASVKLGILQAVGALNRINSLPKPKSLLKSFQPNSTKNEPTISKKSCIEGSRGVNTVLEWNHLFRRQLDRELDEYSDSPYGVTEMSIEPLIELGLFVLEGIHPRYMEWSKETDRFHVGTIGFIQEPGFKLRAVANPSRLVQAALEPLGTALFNCLRILPWDCTFDQSKAFPVVQGHLKQGGYVHSVDLTDASNYFPLDLQKIVLYYLFPNNQRDVDAFIYACRAPWLYRNGPNKVRYLRWTKGQPLGLYPSFASAFLTHGLLLLYLNGYKHDNDFFVLGDDVIILNDELHSKYVTALAELDCPVSEAKCLSSNIAGEFAGKIVTKDLVISQFKWRNPSDDSFLDMVRNIGMKIIPFLRKRQRIIVEKLLEVPTEFGGIGFNPRGLPLSERVFKALQLREGSCNSYLMSYNRSFNTLMYRSEAPHRPLTFIADDDFDKKSISYVLQYLPSLVRLYGTLGVNLSSIRPDLDLPIESGSRHRSLLSILEQKLR